jgi:hypothetical protein
MINVPPFIPRTLPCRHNSDHGRRGVQPPHIRDLVGIQQKPSIALSAGTLRQPHTAAACQDVCSEIDARDRCSSAGANDRRWAIPNLALYPLAIAVVYVLDTYFGLH